MKEAILARHMREAGYDIHFNAGIWWRRVLPCFYKPVFPLRAFAPSASRPLWRKALAGFSHATPEREGAKASWPIMILEKDRLRIFGMKSLNSSKRAQVRKGLRLSTIKKIDDIRDVVEEMKEISISQARRTGHGKPPDYYEERDKEWRAEIFRQFDVPGSEVWGAFGDGRMIAYYYSSLIENTMFIRAAKSLTEYLHLCPNDALAFSFIERCQRSPDCEQVVYGDWSPGVPSLNKFKESYGYRKKEIPIYTWWNPFLRLPLFLAGKRKRGGA